MLESAKVQHFFDICKYYAVFAHYLLMFEQFINTLHFRNRFIQMEM